MVQVDGARVAVEVVREVKRVAELLLDRRHRRELQSVADGEGEAHGGRGDDRRAGCAVVHVEEEVVDGVATVIGWQRLRYHVMGGGTDGGSLRVR